MTESGGPPTEPYEQGAGGYPQPGPPPQQRPAGGPYAGPYQQAPPPYPYPAPQPPGHPYPVAYPGQVPGVPPYGGYYYGPGPYAPMYQQPVVASQPGNGLAVASLVLGITSILFSWLGLLTLVQVVLAMTFGGIGISRANQGASGKGLAIAGLILGCVGLVIYFFVGLASFGLGWLV